MQHFLADENFPLPAVKKLQSLNYDISAVIQTKPGASDDEVLDWAQRENRILLTFDRDFGELIFKRKYSTPAGVVLFRFNPAFSLEPANRLLEILENTQIHIEGNFTVVTREFVRQRKL